MKPVAYILIFLMLFLNAHPLIMECSAAIKVESKATCGTTKCCSKKKQEQKKEDKEEQRSSGCNPFASCSQCQYMAASKYFSISAPLVITKVRLFTTSEDIQSGFLKDCWHPPEV